MEYLIIELNSIPELVLAHYYSCGEEFDTGWRKLPGIEIMLADKGDWQIDISGEKYLQKPGQLCALPLSTPHRITAENPEGKKCAHFALHFILSGSCSILTDAEFRDRITTMSAKADGISSLYHNWLFLPLTPQFEENGLFSAHLKEILREWTGKEPHSKYYAEIIVQKLLADISRACISSAKGDLKVSGRFSNEAVKKAIIYISDNYQNIRSLDDVASHVNLNPSYLGSIFKSCMGISPVNYINAFRVERAKALLAQTNLSFAEIGEKVGISNPYYFSSLFKKYAGMTMSEYSSITHR